MAITKNNLTATVLRTKPDIAPVKKDLFKLIADLETIVDRINSTTDDGAFAALTTTGIVKHAGTPQTLTGAGAVSLTTFSTLLVTTGADALTLADGVEGQQKVITMKTDGGDGTLTPTNFANGTTITFDAVGDTVHLIFLDAKWRVLGAQGVTIA